MLSSVLVLLVASSAFAAPSVSVSTYNINEIAPAVDSGALVSSFLTERCLELVDNGNTNIYTLTIQQILHDLANSRNPTAEASALAQLVALLGELIYSQPGDSCPAASAIDAVASGRGQQGVRSYLIRLTNNIDAIAKAATNPNAFRYAAAPRSNCAGNGRSYQFEAAWDIILDNASPYNIALVNEEYCAAKRLYNAFNVRSNNVGAAVTAASLPQVNAAFKKARVPVANFLRAVASGGDVNQTAAAAKLALMS